MLENANNKDFTQFPLLEKGKKQKEYEVKRISEKRSLVRMIKNLKKWELSVKSSNNLSLIEEISKLVEVNDKKMNNHLFFQIRFDNECQAYMIFKRFLRSSNRLNTNFIILSCLTPKENFKIFYDIFKNSHFIEKLYMDVKTVFSLQRDLSWIYLSLPKFKQVYNLYKYIKRYKRKNQNIQSENNTMFKNFEIYITKNDIKENDGTYLDSIQIYWNNPDFDANNIPYQLENRLKKALSLYDNYNNGINPISDTKNPLYSQFEEILKCKKTIRKNIKDIRYVLDSFKNEKDIINKYSTNSTEYFKNFKEKFSQSMQLLKNKNFRIHFFNPYTKDSEEIYQKYKYQILCNFLETIPTQGTMFMNLIDENLNISTDFFSLQYFHNMILKFCSVTEVKINGNWYFCGMQTGYHKKNIRYHSKQIFVSAFFREEFRGYGLAKLIALLGLLNSRDFYDYIFEDSTILNDSTIRMVDKMGFKTYGLIKNVAYSIFPNILERWVLEKNLIKTTSSIRYVMDINIFPVLTDEEIEEYNKGDNFIINNMRL